MATFTPQILVGRKHSYDGGIINITHSLYLSENDRPAWLLTPTNFFNEHHDSQLNIIWIPTLENMLEDALVMIGLYVLKDQNFLTLANQFLRNHKDNFIELYNDIKAEHLQELYKQAKQIEGSHKIMLSVFEGSTIRSQLAVLNYYQNDIEVCVSTYSKEFSPWSKRFEARGELD